MKKMLLAAITFASVTASAQYVTVTVCDRGETGQQCETITYEVRESEGVPAASHNPSDENQVQAPKKTGIPAWLRRLNEAFGGNRGSHGNNPSNPGYEAP